MTKNDVFDQLKQKLVYAMQTGQTLVLNLAELNQISWLNEWTNETHFPL